MKVKLFFIALLFIVGCQAEDKNRLENKDSNFKADDSLLVKENDSLIPNKQKEDLTFLDSVLKKYELSVNQIRAHTLIDSIYYSSIFKNPVFTGDTIVNFRNSYKGAIITFDDGSSCIYKFLLVFSPSNNLNTDNKIIYTDCDHDESSNYRTVGYKLLNDSAFETVETFIPANSGDKKLNNRIQKIKWSVSPVGLIDSIHH